MDPDQDQEGYTAEKVVILKRLDKLEKTVKIQEKNIKSLRKTVARLIKNTASFAPNPREFVKSLTRWESEK